MFPVPMPNLLDPDSVHVSKASFLLTSLSPHLVHFLAVFLSDPDPAPLFKSTMCMSPWHHLFLSAPWLVGPKSELQGQPCGRVRGPLTKSITDGPGMAVGVWDRCQPSLLLPGTSFLLEENIHEDPDRDSGHYPD